MTLAKTTSSRKRKEPRWEVCYVQPRNTRSHVVWVSPEVMAREEYGELEVDVKIEMIRSLIPLGLMHVHELLDDEVKELAGRAIRS